MNKWLKAIFFTIIASVIIVIVTGVIVNRTFTSFIGVLAIICLILLICDD